MIERITRSIHDFVPGDKIKMVFPGKNKGPFNIGPITYFKEEFFYNPFFMGREFTYINTFRGNIYVLENSNEGFLVRKLDEKSFEKGWVYSNEDLYSETPFQEFALEVESLEWRTHSFNLN